ncbi:MAG: Tyrosine--tRNA ligase 1 [Holosporales bacterium]
MKSSFLKEAKARGFIYQATHLEELDAMMATQSITAYIGFDPTAGSLHVGNMVSIMLLRLLQKHGHKPIVLVGGATAKIGDPTGKDTIRKTLSDDDIQTNISTVKECFMPYLQFGNGESDALLVNNNDWLKDVGYMNFLTDYGRHFSINRMLTFDTVKTRLEREQPLTFLEFNYMILQAYDFVELYKKHNCVLQFGGSDQWGNIVNGVELGRRLHNAPLFGLTTPLVTTSSGVKMGKTLNGAVWLHKDKLSPFDYWQFWRNTEDLDVGKYLRLFTDIDLDEIEQLEKAEGAALNDVKKRLADETTALAHGKDCLESIHATVQSLYEGGQTQDLSLLPTFSIKKEDAQTACVEDLFLHVQLATSKGEVRRLIQGQGAKIQDCVVTDGKATLTPDQLNSDLIKFSSGKKKHHVLKVISA